MSDLDFGKLRRKRERQLKRKEQRLLEEHAAAKADADAKAATLHPSDNNSDEDIQKGKRHRNDIESPNINGVSPAQNRKKKQVNNHGSHNSSDDVLINKSIEPPLSQQESWSSLSTLSPPTKNATIRIKRNNRTPRGDDSDAEPDFETRAQETNNTPQKRLYPAQTTTKRTTPIIVRKKTILREDDSDAEPDFGTPNRAKVSIARIPAVRKPNEDDSDAEPDFGIAAAATTSPPSLRQTTLPYREKSPELLSDSDNEDLMNRETTVKRQNKKEPQEEQRPHEMMNPIVLEKQQFVVSPRLEVRKKSDDHLWSDSEEEQDEARRKKQKRKPNNNSHKNRDGPSSSLIRHIHKRKSSLEDTEENEPDAVAEDAIKPNLEDPKFTPSQENLRPLVLTNGNDTLQPPHQIPPAMNACIKEYQREGVSFLYQAFARGEGCILGDDMGLGKTIQIIALLSALLRKSGTGRDLHSLKQRQRWLENQLERKRAATENTMLYGKRQVEGNGQDDVPNELKEAFGPVLIIVPPSVVDNWLNEFETWGHFGVVNYQDARKRENSVERIKNRMEEMMLTGSGLFQRTEHFGVLEKIPWKLVIVDEFHNYKNHMTIGHTCLKKLKAKHKCMMIGLSGTIMPNEHKELYNLVDLVEPGYLGDWNSFENYVVDPIKIGRTKTAMPDAVERGAQRSKELQDKLKPLLLQRKKESVEELKKELPMKDEKVVFCGLSPIQKRIYQHLMTLPDYVLLRDAKAPCECGVNQRLFMEYKRLRNKQERIQFLKNHDKNIIRRKDCCFQVPYNPDRYDEDEPRYHPMAALWKAYHQDDESPEKCEPCDKCPYCMLLPALTKLYKVCSHAALLQLDQHPQYFEVGSRERAKLGKELEFAKVALPPDVLDQMPGGSYIREDGIMDDHKMLSGKMEVLDELLQACSNRNDRVLIFSYSTKTLGLIQNFARAQGYSFLRIDGATSTSKRQGLVEEFQRDKTIFLFLLSTKACGLGLNITAANVVVVFDVNWNPSLDEQAQDRAYRIGQKQDVQVVRLVSRGTIEELMYVRQVYKVQLKQETLGDAGLAGKNVPNAARLFRGVAGDDSRKGELFGTENLLKYKDGSFMAEIWKTTTTETDSRKARRRGMGSVQLHDTRDLSNAISDMTEEQIENIGNPELDETFERMASTDNERSDDEQALPLNNGQNLMVETKAISHEDFLRRDRGEAALQPGDEGFEVEMGGLSQVVHNVMELADIDAMEEEEDEGSTPNVDGIKVEPRPASNDLNRGELSPIAENNDGEYDMDTQPIIKEDAPRPDRIASSIIPVFRLENNIGTGDTAGACVGDSRSSLQVDERRKAFLSEKIHGGTVHNESERAVDTQQLSENDAQPSLDPVGEAITVATSSENGNNKTEERKKPQDVEETTKRENSVAPQAPARSCQEPRQKRDNTNIRLMGRTRKKVNQAKIKSRFTAADILGNP